MAIRFDNNMPEFNNTQSREKKESISLTKRIYFPGLNSIRFYAAISVLIAHTKTNFGEMRTQPAYIGILDFLTLDAQSAVNLFLVLSGFLITYLLLYERSSEGSIDIPRFYLRRILRIWPLYYWIVILGLVILPFVIGPEYALSEFPLYKSILILLMLPNFVGALGPLSHLWSIGLEEQFYLIWPWVLQSTGRFIRVSLGILIVKAVIAPVIASLQDDSIQKLFLYLRFECMAIGSLGAYLYFYKHRFIKYICSPTGQLIGIFNIIFLAVFDIPLTFIGIIITSLLFTVLLLNIATNPEGWLIIENDLLNSLGRVSYGVYLYHYPIIYLTILSLNTLGIPEGPGYSLLLYSVTIFLTIGLSLITYRWFETPFLKIKEGFAVVRTRR